MVYRMVFMVAYGLYPSLLLLGDFERPVQVVQGAGHDFVVILVDLRLRTESLDMLRAFLLADLHLAKGVELLVALHGHFDVSTPQRFLERSLVVLKALALQQGLRKGFKLILTVLPLIQRLVLLEHGVRRL